MNTTPFEDQECYNLVSYLNIRKIKFAHIPNETYTPYKSIINKNKKLWVKKWLPDYLIKIDKKRSKDWKSYLLFIEMKRQKWWVVSKEQKEWIEELNDFIQVKAFIAKWFNEAKQIVENFI